MKELKKREVIHNEEFDINIKPYLTIAEIELIVNKVSSIENVVQRQLLKDMLVIKFCTDIEGVDDLDYDLIVESGLMRVIYDNIQNYFEIDIFMREHESINRIVARFLESVAKTADKAVKNMPKTPKSWEKLISKFSDVVNKNDDK